jgi:hypothetical protein
MANGATDVVSFGVRSYSLAFLDEQDKAGQEHKTESGYPFSTHKPSFPDQCDVKQRMPVYSIPEKTNTHDFSQEFFLMRIKFTVIRFILLSV